MSILKYIAWGLVALNVALFAIAASPFTAAMLAITIVSAMITQVCIGMFQKRAVDAGRRAYELTPAKRY